jgi:hypothetical protein
LVDVVVIHRFAWNDLGSIDALEGVRIVSHMVIYRGSDGKPGYHQVDDIHDAVSFVEEMRNNDGVDHARIFRLEEVTFEFKPYYRVEIGNGSSIAETADTDADADDSGEDDEESSVVEIVEPDEDSDSGDSDQSANGSSDDEVAEDLDAIDDEDSSSGARRGLFGR